MKRRQLKLCRLTSLQFAMQVQAIDGFNIRKELKTVMMRTNLVSWVATPLKELARM